MLPGRGEDGGGVHGSGSFVTLAWIKLRDGSRKERINFGRSDARRGCEFPDPAFGRRMSRKQLDPEIALRLPSVKMR